MAQVLSLWLKFKTYFQATLRWIAKRATIGNFVTLIWAGITLLICGLIVQDLMRDVVTIEPISVPKALSDNGYTPEVAGHRLRDALNSYAGISQRNSTADNSDLNLRLDSDIASLRVDLDIAARDELPDFVVPQIGLSLNAIVSSIRSVLHSRSGQAISGEIVLSDKDKYALRVRVDGRQVNGGEFESEKPDDLMDKAAPDVMAKIKPSVTAMALYREHPEEGLLEADDIIARFDQSDVNVQWAYVLKGNHSFDQHDYADAERMFRTAIKLNWSNPGPHIQLGLALQRQGKFDEAIKQFQRVLSINPKLALAYNNIGVALATRAKSGDKLENAIAQYRQAIKVDPRYPLPYNNLGLALSHRGDVDNAIAEYHKAIQADPKYLFAHWNLAYALKHQAKLDEALAEYRAAIECTNDPKQRAILHTSVGDVLKQKAGADGNMDGAIAEYRRAIGFDPDFRWAHYNLGLIWRAQGRLEDAIAEFRSATKTYTEIEDMRDSLARALQEKDASAAKEASELKD